MRNFIHTLQEYSQLNEQIENVELYHGSNVKFSAFDNTLISSGDGSDLFGKGYYFTDNKNVADFYAHLRSKKDRIMKYDNSGIFGTEVPIYHKDADEYASVNKVVNTFTIRGNILNSEEFIIDDKFEKYIKDSYVKHTGLTDEYAVLFFNTLRNRKHDIHNFRGELEYIIKRIGRVDIEITKDIINYIKMLGYDGLKYRADKNFEGNENSWNYVIYNRNVIH